MTTAQLEGFPKRPLAWTTRCLGPAWTRKQIRVRPSSRQCAPGRGWEAQAVSAPLSQRHGHLGSRSHFVMPCCVVLTQHALWQTSPVALVVMLRGLQRNKKGPTHPGRWRAGRHRSQLLCRRCSTTCLERAAETARLHHRHPARVMRRPRGMTELREASGY